MIFFWDLTHELKDMEEQVENMKNDGTKRETEILRIFFASTRMIGMC